MDTGHAASLHARNAAAGFRTRHDAVEQRFGMREFTIRGTSYYLNGKKIYLKAGFWEGFYPQTLAFPPNADSGTPRNPAGEGGRIQCAAPVAQAACAHDSRPCR